MPEPAAAGSSRSVLLVLPAADARAFDPGRRILGVEWARRIALGARRSGFDRVLFAAGESPALRRAVEGTGTEIAGPAAARLEGPARLVAVAADRLALPSWLESARGIPVARGRFALARDAALVCDVPSGESLSIAAGGEGGVGGLENRLRQVRPGPPEGLDDDGLVAIAGEAGLRRAERTLLSSLVKESEGFMSRHFERKISLSLSRRLAATTVSPNAMTLVSVAVGLSGAALFAFSRVEIQFLGSLLFLAHSILDGCDGELARLRFQESRVGGILDFWGDNLVHAAVFSGIAVSWARAEGAAWPLSAGALAVSGTLLSAGLVFAETMSGDRTGPLFRSVAAAGESALAAAADALARRDFIYVVVVLSAFGKARWFLALAAVGAPAYFLVLAIMAIRARQKRSAT